MERCICVYSGSSRQAIPRFARAAAALGAAIAGEGYTLVYGGASVGLMGILADAVRQAGGRVVGVIPVSIHARGIFDRQADELIVTADLRERKAVMESRADAFIALPGGFGTLEELLECLTLKQLGYHTKPVVLFNVDQFYDPLLDLFEHLTQAGFVRDSARRLFHVASTTDDIFRYLETYEPPDLESKWA